MCRLRFKESRIIKVDRWVDFIDDWRTCPAYIVEILSIESTCLKKFDTHKKSATTWDCVVRGVCPIAVVCHLFQNRQAGHTATVLYV